MNEESGTLPHQDWAAGHSTGMHDIRDIAQAQ